MTPEWTQALGRHSRGSRPRCVALVNGTDEAVAATLTNLVGLPDVGVDPAHRWMPAGTPVKTGGTWDETPAREARLERDPEFLPADVRRVLKDWWLAVGRGANTPNWDLASSCVIEGERGLLLVEAKAHANELSAAGKSLPETRNGWKNHQRIGEAIAAANVGIAQMTGGYCSLSRDDRYQLSNRFAWSWKIVSLGVPVVLVYLGFLDAEDMRPDGTLFHTHEDWVDAVRQHATGLVNESSWGNRFEVEGVPFRALIRSRRQELAGRTGTEP